VADKSFRCRLITPESRVFDEHATYVSIPLHDGMSGILPNRAPFVAKLGLGELKITFEKGGGSRSFLLEDGFGQMVGDSLTILAQRAVPAEEIVVADAKAELAEHIASRDDWDFASLEMGINVGGWTTEEFHGKVERFVDILSAAHPDKWIFCIDVFRYAGDLVPDYQGHPKFREAVAEVVATLGRPKVVHVDGRDILQDICGLTHDLVHPTDDGFIEMGRRLAERIRTTMGE